MYIFFHLILSTNTVSHFYQLFFLFLGQTVGSRMLHITVSLIRSHHLIPAPPFALDFCWVFLHFRYTFPSPRPPYTVPLTQEHPRGPLRSLQFISLKVWFKYHFFLGFFLAILSVKSAFTCYNILKISFSPYWNSTTCAMRWLCLQLFCEVYEDIINVCLYSARV